MKRSLLLGLLVLLPFSACKKKTAPAETVAENVIGVAFYPKSTEWSTASSAGDESGNASSVRQTDDPPDKVIAFYKEQIKEAKVTADGFSDLVHTNITGKTKDGSDVEVLVMKMPQQKTQIFVSVRRKK
jgi:hypothetical protein